jgi:hypothetical protein
VIEVVRSEQVGGHGVHFLPIQEAVSIAVESKKFKIGEVGAPRGAMGYLATASNKFGGRDASVAVSVGPRQRGFPIVILPSLEAYSIPGLVAI